IFSDRQLRRTCHLRVTIQAKSQHCPPPGSPPPTVPHASSFSKHPKPILQRPSPHLPGIKRESAHRSKPFSLSARLSVTAPVSTRLCSIFFSLSTSRSLATGLPPHRYSPARSSRSQRGKRPPVINMCPTSPGPRSTLG